MSTWIIVFLDLVTSLKMMFFSSIHLPAKFEMSLFFYAVTLRETINKWDLLKLKSFCKAKSMVNKTKQQPTEWEKIFTNPTSGRGLISRIYKELKKLVIKRTNNPIKNGVQT